MSFSSASAVRSSSGTRYAWEVPDGWQQGRGAWGGLVAAAVARAVSDVDASRPLRTLSLHLSAPVGVGTSTLDVVSLRAGTAMSTWQVVVESGSGERSANAVAITGTARAEDLAHHETRWGTVVAPTLPPYESLEPIPSAPALPRFIQHVELRVGLGMIMGGGAARTAGYVRFREPTEWDVPALLAIVDAWWPTPYPVMTDIRPMATVVYAADVLVQPSSLEPGTALVHESFLSGAHEGFVSETRRIWTLDGRLAVENHQTMVIIR